MTRPGLSGTTTPSRLASSPVPVLDVAQQDFMAARRSAVLVTLSASGQPRLVPICFVLSTGEPGAAPVLYSPLDEKPKRIREVRHLARVRDILERPEVSLLFERWSEDWSELAWLRARGRATLVEPGQDPEAHARLVAALREKYPQYHGHDLDAAPMISVVILEVASWSARGDLDGEPGRDLDPGSQVGPDPEPGPRSRSGPSDSAG